MKKIKIALDVDGVLLNFMDTIGKFMVTTYGLKQNPVCNLRQYNLAQRFEKKLIDEIGFNVIKDCFEKEGHWKTLEPMPNSEKIQELINNPLFEIYFVTSIPVHLHEDRLQNLELVLNTKIKNDNLFCVPLGVSKKSFIEAIKPDFFVEDNLKNLAECHNVHHSIWIDLKEDCYDHEVLKEYNINAVNSFNDSVDLMKSIVAKELNINQIIKEIQNCLTDDLLTPAYRKLNRTDKTEGHCYASSEAIYHMLGGSAAGLTPCVASFMKNGEKLTHWWLRDKDNNIIDPTADQFYTIGKEPPYDLGKGSGFLTKYPSKRAKEMIKRITSENMETKDYKIKKRKL